MVCMIECVPTIWYTHRSVITPITAQAWR